MSSFSSRAALALLAAATLGAPAFAQSTTAAAQLARFESAAGAASSAARGQQLFTAKAGNDLNCASCHGLPPTSAGRHANTGKPIDPLAPAFNATGFTDQAKVDKWFRRNCKDVFARECSPAEKADFMAYLMSLK